MKENQETIDDHHYPIVMFGNEMFKELESHNSQKDIKFYSMSVEKLFQLLHEQADFRLENINHTIFREDMPLIDIEKNCIHLANYCYFLWSQSKKMREHH